MGCNLFRAEIQFPTYSSPFPSSLLLEEGVSWEGKVKNELVDLLPFLLSREIQEGRGD